MIAERHQCLVMFGELEAKVSAISVIHGPEKSALSENKVMYGEMAYFMGQYKSQLDEIDSESGTDNTKLRAVFDDLLEQREADERVYYTMVTYGLRARIPYRFDLTKSGTFAGIFNTKWITETTSLDDLARQAEAAPQDETLQKDMGFSNQ